MRMIFEHASRMPGNTAFDAVKFKPARNRPYPSTKPYPSTALWASIANEQKNWTRYIAQNYASWEVKSGFTFALDAMARLVVVRTIDDIDNLPKLYKDEHVGFDWEDMSRTIDAVLMHDAVINEHPFIGWDVPSLVVLNPDVVQTNHSPIQAV